MNSVKRIALLLITLCITHTIARAQVDSVMQSVTLKNLEVKAARYTSKLKSDASGKMSLDVDWLKELPQILGNADPIRYSQMLPEIQTNGEYRTGINVQGSESSHTQVSMGGIPVYYPNHLLGLFSTFNVLHYDRCSISKFLDAKSSNRLGGELMMEVPAIDADSLRGEVSLGLIASQGTVSLPLGKKTSVKASFRTSYINLLYSSWLKSEDSDVRYSFYDVNFTLKHEINSKNVILLDYYGGQDDGTFKANLYEAKMHAKWGNQLAGLHHNYVNDSGLAISNKLYFTSYHNNFHLKMQEAGYKLPSAIRDFGFKNQSSYKRWSWGADFVYHHIKPQSLSTEGAVVVNNDPPQISNSLELSVYAAYRQPLMAHAHIEAGVRGNLYKLNHDDIHVSADPSLKFSYNNYNLDFFAGYALKHQYLFQAGFSDVGLPTEFWFSSDKNYKPQYAHSVDVGISSYLFSRQYKASAAIFYKRLYNQVEYVGTLLDFVNEKYNLTDHLQQGDGRNYGASVMLNKCSGNLTGWLSYTFTRVRRTFYSNEVATTYPASHERPHEINAVMSYAINKRWSLGTTLVFASGTPFTAADYLSLINGNIMAHYKEYNSGRLKPYFRWDVSANYKWKPRFARENGFNFSVYNLTARNNELFYSISIKKDGTLSYKPRSFITRILPSVSYYIKF